MPLDRRSVESALEGKGFKRVEGDHAFFIYYSLAGKKSPVRTKTSHGSGHKDIGDDLVSRMAKQCKLTAREFRELVDCALTQTRYEAKLLECGLVDEN